MKPRILVVDDEEPIRTVIEKYLKGEDIVIDASAGFADAVSLLESNQYDIIMIDKNMPGIDGLGEGGMDLLRHIRSKLIPARGHHDDRICHSGHSHRGDEIRGL